MGAHEGHRIRAGKGTADPERLPARTSAECARLGERLQALAGKPGQTAAELPEAIKKEPFAFIDREQRSDDVTMLAVQRAPAV